MVEAAAAAVAAAAELVVIAAIVVATTAAVGVAVCSGGNSQFNAQPHLIYSFWQVVLSTTYDLLQVRHCMGSG